MGALRRRWLLTTFLLLVTCFFGYNAYAKHSGPYSAESMVALVPSKQSSVLNGNNPYLSYGTSEIVAGDIVQRLVSAPDSAAKLAKEGYTGAFTMVDDSKTTGPIVDITVTDSSPVVVENTLRGVTNAFQAQLVKLQSNLKANDRITSQVVSFDPTASVVTSKKLRTVVEYLGLGLILTYVLPQIVDGNIERRRSRRATRNFPAPEPQAAGGGDGGGYRSNRPSYYPSPASPASPARWATPRRKR